MRHLPTQQRRARRTVTGQPVGEAHHAAKLTEEQVRELRQLHYEKGVCTKCACVLVGVPYQRGYEAISFLTWKHVR